MRVKLTNTSIHCPNCNYTMNYLKIKTNTHKCRKCGHEWPAGKSGK